MIGAAARRGWPAGCRCGWIRGLTFPAYLVSLVLLLATAFFGIVRQRQPELAGVGPLVIQPSEIAKLALVLWAAHVYANKERRLGQLHADDRAGGARACCSPPTLVVLGRDLGTALVFFAIAVGLLLVVGAPRASSRCASSGSARSCSRSATTDTERVGRITNFADPFKDFHDAGWQPAHGLYALSSGGWLGQGIGASQQKWGDLPEAHTDFIFAVLGEELGLVGTLLVIGLFLTIAYAALRVARETADPFVRYATFGIVVWLLGQMMINVGMVLALLPVIGIPLPLVSYGGSALVPSLVALGLLVGFARREPDGGARPGAAQARSAPAGLSARHAPTPLPRVGPDARPPRRRRHRRPHLAPARDRRRPAPSRPRTSRSPASARRAGSRTRVVPEAGYPLELIAPVPLPRKPGVDLLRVPGRLRAAVPRGPRRPRPGPPRRRRRLRRLRLDAGLPRRPAPRRTARGARAERPARPGQQGRRPGRGPGRGQLPRHPAAQRGVRRPARSAG